MKTKSWFIFLVMLLISLTFGCNDVGNDINDSNQDNSSQDNDYNNSNGNEDGNYDNNQSYYSVYFYTESWDEVYVYAWDENGSNSSWPGVKMVYESDGWFKGSVDYSNVIFNNNSEQTVDLISQNGYFVPEYKNSEGKYEGKWYSTKPSVSNNYEDDSESDYNDENSSDIDDYLEAPVLVGSHSSEFKTIGLNWDEIENAEKYVVYLNTKNDSSSSMKVEEVTTNYTRIKDDGLAGLKIYFWVKAVKDSIYSDFSNCVEIYVSEEEESTDTNNPSEDNGTNTPSDEEDDEVVDDLIEPVLDNNYQFRFTDDKKGFSIRLMSKEDNIDSRTKKYRLYRSQDKYENYEIVKEYDVEDFSFVFEDKTVDMTAGNIYYYRVSAVCGKTEAKSEKGIQIKLTPSEIVTYAKKADGTKVLGNYYVSFDEGKTSYPCVISRDIDKVSFSLEEGCGSFPIWIKVGSGGNWTKLANHDFLPMTRYQINLSTKTIGKYTTSLMKPVLFSF